MEAGLTVVGDHGVMQIDSKYRNYGLVAKGQAVSVPPGPNIGGRFTISVANVVAPQIFVRGQHVALWEMSVANGVWTWIYSSFTVPGELLDWWVFDLFGGPGMRTNFGIEIFSPTGEFIFGSGQKPLDIKRVYTPPSPTPFNPYGPSVPYQQADGPWMDVAHPYVARWAACLTSQRWGMGIASSYMVGCTESIGCFDDIFSMKFTQTGGMVEVESAGTTGVQVYQDPRYTPQVLFIDGSQY